MSRVCEFAGTRPMAGNLVSHSKIKTKTRQLPNLLTKRYFVPELKRNVAVQLTARSIRTIDKQGGLSKALKLSNGKTLSSKLIRLKRDLEKAN
jgi:large subunit ribosomal protein L28